MRDGGRIKKERERKKYDAPLALWNGANRADTVARHACKQESGRVLSVHEKYYWNDSGQKIC